MSAKHELRALTSMRGIAACIVVLYHISDNFGALRFVTHGYLAVDFFFLLSGFVIWLTYSDRIRAGGFAAIPEFLKRRIARIWPLHAFILACWAVLIAGAGLPGYHFSSLPLQVLMMHNWGFTTTLGWNAPSWSISTEMLAYAAFPVLALCVDWRRLPTVGVIGAILGLAGLLYVGCLFAGWDTLLPSIPKLGVARCLIEFSIGTAVCALWLRWREDWKMAAVVAATVAAMILGLWGAGVAPEPLAIPLGFATLLLTLALAADKAGNPLEVAPLHYLGEISFSIYLSHSLIERLFRLSLGDTLTPLGLAAYFAAVLLCSALLYHMVERPAQHWINKLRLPPLSIREVRNDAC